MKKSLLNKVLKSTSIALLAGGMVCGANLTAHVHASVNRAAAHEEAGIRKGTYNRHNLGAVRLPDAVRHIARKNNRKPVRLNVRKHSKSVKPVKRINKRGNRAVRRNKKVVRHRIAKRINRKPVRRRGTKRINRTYRRTRDFRQTASYRRVWNRAKKYNQGKLRFDYRALRVDQAQLRKQKTNYGRRAYRGYIKSIRSHINNLRWWVRHDAHMLSLR